MSLTPDQQKAVTLTDKSVVVVAGAGSGKTRVLTEHFKQLVTASVPVYRIAAFTFTEKAADEIRERLLADEIIRPEEEVLAQIGTIHSFCARLLKRHGPEIGLDPSFSIAGEAVSRIDEEEGINVFLSDALARGEEPIASFCRQSGFGKVTSLIGDLLDEPRLYLSGELTGLSDEEKALIKIVHTFSEHQRTQRMASALLSFDDLEQLTLRLFSSHPDIVQKIAERYLHILVDEFQDTNPVQGEIISKIHRPETNQLFIVGDPRQSIYRFRRADVSLFRETARQIKKEGGELAVLSDSFRLAPELLAPLNKIFTPLFDEGENPFPYGPMTSQRDPGSGKFRIVLATGEKSSAADQKRAEASFIAETLSSLHLSDEELDETAILFRYGEPLSLFREELVRRGIPCRVTRTEELFSYPEIRDLLHVVGYVGGERSRLTMAGILRSSFFRFSELFIERFLISGVSDFSCPFSADFFIGREASERSKQANPPKAGQTARCSLTREAQQSLLAHPAMPTEGATLAPTIDQNDWEHLRRETARWEKLKDKVKPSKLVFEMTETLFQPKTLTEQKRMNIEQFIHLVSQMEKEGPPNFDDVARKFIRMRETGERLMALELKSAAGGVKLMTIHAAKGLEFKRVFLPQLAASGHRGSPLFLFDPSVGIAFKRPDPERGAGLKISLKESPLFLELKKREDREEREEAKRLLYVALTRARDEVTLFLHEPSKSRIKLAETANWNDWLWALLEEERKEGIPLNKQFERPPSFDSLAGKIEKILKDPERMEKKATHESTIERSNDRTIEPKLFKPSYTVSQVEAFLRCGKEYELRFVRGIDPVTNQNDDRKKIAGFEVVTGTGKSPIDLKKQHFPRGADWGTLVHEILQFVDCETLSNLGTVVEQALINRRISPSVDLVTAITDELTPLLQNTTVRNHLVGEGEIFCEIPFLLDLGPFYLKGKIDRLFRKEGIWTAVDYKTDRIVGNDELSSRASAYEAQMACYAVAVSQIMGEEVARTSLIFASLPAVETRVWTRKDLESAKTRLAALHPMAGPFRHTDHREFCPHCPYYPLDYCGVKKLPPVSN